MCCDPYFFRTQTFLLHAKLKSDDDNDDGDDDVRYNVASEFDLTSGKT